MPMSFFIGLLVTIVVIVAILRYMIRDGHKASLKWDRKNRAVINSAGIPQCPVCGSVDYRPVFTLGRQIMVGHLNPVLDVMCSNGHEYLRPDNSNLRRGR